jgi:hypothetical protein
MTFNSYLTNYGKKKSINDEQDLDCMKTSVVYWRPINISIFWICPNLAIIKFKLYFQRIHTFIPNSRVTTPKLSLVVNYGLKTIHKQYLRCEFIGG